MTSPTLAIGRDWRIALAALVYACLATVGVFAGGAYAALAFGLGAVLLVAASLQSRWPAIDRQLALLGILFVLLCWVGTLWSVAPMRTVRGAAQITAIFLGCLVLLGQRRALEPGADLVLRAALAAALAGASIAFADMLADYPIMRRISVHADFDLMAARYDRGLSYLTVLIWPIVAQGWRTGRRLLTLAAGVAVIAAVARGPGVAGQVGMVISLVAVGAAAVAPAAVALGLAGVVCVLAAATPFLVLQFGARLIPLARGIRFTAVHRLEIWDYMSARALERPWTGWGLWSSRALPIRPDELSRYQYVTAMGVPHPHSNWVQLWVETGVPGVALGLLFALLIIRRAWRMSPEVRPFALASCAAAITVSLASFDLVTDSLWAALAATGLLFGIMPAGAVRP